MLALYIIITFICTVLYFTYYFLTRKHDYWKKRNVPHLKASSVFGNYLKYVFLQKYSPQITHEICLKFPNEPFVGVYYGSDPALIVKDPDLIKLIMTKDFYYFNMREISDHVHKESVTQNMFFNGGDRWKVLRQNLSPMFSSTKLKKMFYLIENCSKALEETIREETHNSNVVEVKSLTARYTMDCIGSCVFGVNTGTLSKNPDNNPFTIISEKLVDSSTFGGFKIVTRAMWPSIFYGLGFKIFSNDINDFFHKLLRGVFENRQYKESGRHDFVDLLLNWKQKDVLVGDSITNLKTGEKTLVQLSVDNNLIIAQCALLFAAGFETTASTISFLLYELAKHRDAQTRVIEEIDDYFKRHESVIEFEAITEMPYLQACIEETLRLYPVLGLLTRETVEEYTLPTGLRLEKGCRIHIPVHHIQRSPDNFQNPDEFQPERFFGEERKNIKPFTYIPFGEGPRICLGMRFSKMPITAGLLKIYKNYQVETCENTPTSYEFQPTSFSIKPIAEPIIESFLGEQTKHLTFAYVDVGDPEQWRDRACPFRTDSRIKLLVIPTIIKWKGVQRLEGSQCSNRELLQMLIEDED